MILFLNGPFGVGKTSAARVLVEEIPASMLYDPEVIGCVLQRTLGRVKKVDDYQDSALWRRLVVGVARALRAVSARTLVIPMTVWRRDYFAPIVAGLRRVDQNLRCFRLTASERELKRRIASDSDDTGAYGWRVAHVEGLHERFARSGLRDGSADGRPCARWGRWQEPEERKHTDRLG